MQVVVVAEEGSGLQVVVVVTVTGPESQVVVVEADCHFSPPPPHGSGPQSEKLVNVILYSNCI